MTAIRITTIPDVAPATMPGEYPVYGSQEAADAAAEPKKNGGPIRVTTLAPIDMAASTIAPKGGTPFQPTLQQDQAFELLRQLKQGMPGQAPGIPPTPLGNFTLSAANTIGNNILAAPSVAADLLSYPARFITGQNMASGQVALPDLSVVPKPTVEGIAAKLRSVTGDTTEAQARANIQEAEQQRREQFPTATSLGDIMGDVATLGMGRGPFTESLREKEVDLARKVAHGKTVYESWPFLNAAERNVVFSQSPGYNLFKRGLRRAGEAGVEGATLALLHGGDPVETGAFTAGAQGFNSAATDILTRKFVKLPSRLATFAINGYLLSNLLYAADVALPGEAKDYEASKAATQKMLWGYGLGGLTAMVSARGRSGFVSAAAPHLIDALASAPRNAMQSVLNSYVNSDPVKRQSIKAKIQGLYDNLDQYTLPQLRDLSAAFASGDTDRFLTTLDKTRIQPQ